MAVGKDVMFFVEHLNGKVAEISFEIAGRARALAGETGGRSVAVVLGQGARALAGQVAADVAVCVDRPELAQYNPAAYAAALGALVRDREPVALLLGNTSMGLDLAPAVSGALGRPLLAYCKEVRVEGERVVGVSQVYGGKVLVEAEAPAGAVVSVMAGAYPADAGRGAPGAVEEAAPPANGLKVRFKSLIEPEAADVDITKQDILVSIGRGIQSQDNIPLAEELAEALGGAVSASRPIIDAGWLPKARQVGKSGQTVKPKVYLALGISGAPEHLEGMRDAGLIIAVNTDAKAPIFDVAHYGVVADLFDILPALTEKVKEAAG